MLRKLSEDRIRHRLENGRTFTALHREARTCGGTTECYLDHI
jgi:hypothetical protein